MDALQALSKVSEESGLAPNLLQLVQLRASQINCCSVCVDGHAKILKKLNEPDHRIIAISAWQDTPYYSDAERAALALTESITRLADRPDPVPNEIYEAAKSHFQDPQLAALILAIATINIWNRLNAATHQQAGEWNP
jgi:AhpD family alkylhydroperoxidase